MRLRGFSCTGWVLLLAAAPIAATAESLRIELRDEHGQPVTARLEVHGSGGRMFQPADGAILSRPPGRPDSGSPYLRSFITRSGSATIELPSAGRYRVVAEHGLEYERVVREVDVARDGATTIEIQLRPWIRMRERGWWSGDMHVHRPMEDVPALLEAEDLNLAVVFTMWNRQNHWGAGGLPGADWIRKTGAHRWMTVTNAEDERGGGAWMLHGLTAPLGLDQVVAAGERPTESWDPPGIEFVRQARAGKRHGRGGLFPWFDLEKPIWWEAPVMMALARPDSMGLLHNHYNQYGMYDNEAWGRKRDAARFPGPSGFSDYSLHLMYRYWNLGWLVTPSAGAASGVLPNPVGYNRLYVKMDGGEFHSGKWYEGVRAGGARVMVSNGPLVFFEPKLRRGARRLRGSIEVSSRDELEAVEIVANGQVLRAWKPGAKQFRAMLDLDIAGHSWVAARAFARNGLTVRLGHTAPVKTSAGAGNGSQADARYFREWLEELAHNPKTPPGGKAAALYREAMGVYRAMEK